MENEILVNKIIKLTYMIYCNISIELNYRIKEATVEEKVIMGGTFMKSRGPRRLDITVRNRIHGDDNVIIDHTAPCDPTPQPRCSSDTKGSAITICALNNIKGKRNRIERGPPTSTQNDTSVSSKPRRNATSKPTANFLKSVDDKDFIRNRRIISKASHSVGMIRGPGGGGTGFRVGENYVMTARHVVIDNIKVFYEINHLQINNSNFFIEFEYLKSNQKQNPEHIFYFKDMVYENEELDTAILELEADSNRSFPPPINILESIDDERPIYLIGHPNGQPLMDDPKIEIYQYCKNDVDRANKKAGTITKHCRDYYEGIDDQQKCLFHCASQHGASGALGVMVTPRLDEPVGVLMLLRGFPNCYYSKHLSFSDEDKKDVLIVEQGVLLKSIENDMILNGSRPHLKNDIFRHPNGQPLMDDPKIEIYQYCKNDVDRANKKAGTITKDYRDHYEGIDDQQKCLFHCASQHGASGALGVMVTPHFDEPV
ncbi:unnamed protein product [Mytilus coruscus]|uniref:Peptidase S1 domain-containing protein n=1 Tax=Mytilus coruscus TaxID=42192 RepID=A0A6J8D1N4_MYTCO|nr:unnamed protein product [Mytilus coruscus]